MALHFSQHLLRWLQAFFLSPASYNVLLLLLLLLLLLIYDMTLLAERRDKEGKYGWTEVSRLKKEETKYVYFLIPRSPSPVATFFFLMFMDVRSQLVHERGRKEGRKETGSRARAIGIERPTTAQQLAISFRVQLA